MFVSTSSLVPLLVVIVMFGIVIERCDSLSCPRCTPEYKAKHCQKITCPYGVTGDICGCCSACFKGENEDCGGIWNHGGTCSPRLELICKENDKNWQQTGKCIKNNPNPVPNYLTYK